MLKMSLIQRSIPPAASSKVCCLFLSSNHVVNEQYLLIVPPALCLKVFSLSGLKVREPVSRSAVPPLLFSLLNCLQSTRHIWPNFPLSSSVHFHQIVRSPWRTQSWIEVKFSLHNSSFPAAFRKSAVLCFSHFTPLTTGMSVSRFNFTFGQISLKLTYYFSLAWSPSQSFAFRFNPKCIH